MRRSKLHWVIRGKKTQSTSQALRRLRDVIQKGGNEDQTNMIMYQNHVHLAALCEKFRQGKPWDIPESGYNQLMKGLTDKRIRLHWDTQSMMLSAEAMRWTHNPRRRDDDVRDTYISRALM